MRKTKRARTRPLNPTHHWWKRLKKKEIKGLLVWKCRKCGEIREIKREPGKWLKPNMSNCPELHRTKLSQPRETEEEMKSYPSITAQACGSMDMIVFDKLDGSNIRAEWSSKRGFYKYGTRRRMIDHTDPHLGKAVLLIKQKYEEDLDKIFRKKPNKWQRGVVCFFEFFGPNSFAGQHAAKDTHDVVLFDVSPNKAGLIPPREFVKLFGGLDIPAILHEGKVGKELIEKVRSSSLEGMTFEGVVCKAPNPNRKRTSHPVMFKIKSTAWLEKLKSFCGDDIRLFVRLK